MPRYKVVQVQVWSCVMFIPLPICFTEHDIGGVKYVKDTVTRRPSAHATFLVSIQLDEDHVQVLLEDRNPLRPSHIKVILGSELLEIEDPLREGLHFIKFISAVSTWYCRS